ncbi:dolichyl-phosphate beta-glucosyltransferase-like [Paramacrobiotus metropolitanus]|uniref:dolichyl-phosphate beta-glucosyltransferase-like n=1 Tax=Paramacrobiotus metropolitanus TaxID=2943436 RepID=UPI0024462E0A|nr:dolichyl-phosphate beta-glucosyltransferase-like [Paramacrobiotus metropolitanus]
MVSSLYPHSFLELVAWTIFLGIMAFAGLLFYFKKRTPSAKAYTERYQSECFYFDPTTKRNLEFPSLLDPPSVQLTVVIPAYKETSRLPSMLDECLEFLEHRRTDAQFTYEIIVVDDGSGDETSKVALEYAEKFSTDKVRVLTLEKNRGKGGAIKLGVLSARGRHILMADADGATKFSDLDHLKKSMKAHSGDVIAIGSRAHLEQRAVAERSFFRNLLMWGFKAFVYVAGVKGLKDTQCGFKLFTRGAASKCFQNLHVDRWAFDVELLYIAERFGIKVNEVAVNWREMEGSKLIPVFSWLQMASDIARMRLCYIFGIWEIDFSVE